MNRPSQTLLAPLLALLAMLLELTENASSAFNEAAKNPHYGNFSLWETEASRVFGYEIAHPTREIGVWVYDGASGVPVYVRQSPWSSFDPDRLAGKDLAPEDSLKDGKVTKEELVRIDWKKGQAEEFLKQNGQDTVTQGEAKESITYKDWRGNDKVHSWASSEYEAWKNGASIDDVTASYSARKNKTKASWYFSSAREGVYSK